jgi:predicted transporter
MLWITIAILSGGVLTLLMVTHLVGRRYEVVESFMKCTGLWVLNAVFGLTGFFVAQHVSFWVWKPWLVASAFCNVGLIGAGLWIQRRWRLERDDEPRETRRPDGPIYYD